MIKYTLAFACSSDGFIAKYSGDNPFEWTSLEDKKHLDKLIKNHKWQVMGRKTHELNPNESRSRIIFSRKYQKIKQIKNSINQYYFNPDINQWDEFESLCKESVLIPIVFRCPVGSLDSGFLAKLYIENSLSCGAAVWYSKGMILLKYL